MLDINEFLRTEVDEHVKNTFYQAIIEGLMDERVAYNIVLNRFSVDLDFTDKSVVLQDDIFPEDGNMRLSLQEFFALLKSD